MSSKSAIFEALASSSVTEHHMPAIDIVANNHDLIAQFGKNLQAVGGKLQRDAEFSQIQTLVDKLANKGECIISLIPNLIGNCEMPATPHELKNINYAILYGEVAVAENGAVWVQQPNGHRNIPFICENLLLIVQQQNIVANMHEAMKKITLDSGKFGSFIAGPSKTADIEQALVIGAHGAFSLNVYLI